LKNLPNPISWKNNTIPLKHMTIELDPNYDVPEYLGVPAEEESGKGNTAGIGSISPLSSGGVAPLRPPRASPPLGIPDPQSASELIAEYPNLSLASIGIMLMINMVYEKMEAENEAIEFLRRTSKKMRQNIIDGNNNVLKAIQAIGEENTNKHAGIGPSGAIKTDNESLWDKAWKWLVAIAILVVAALVAIFVPGGALLALGIIMVLMISAQIINLLINTGAINENSKIARDIADIFSLLNPIYLALDMVSTFVIEILEGTGAISHEEAKRGRMIAALVVQIASAIIMIIVSIAIAVVTFGTATAPAAASIAMAVANIITAVLGLVNGVFGIVKAVRQLELADEVFECEKLAAVIEAIKMALQNLTSTIDSMIQALKSDFDDVSTAFTGMTEIVKREYDTKASIARNITI
jgi:cell division protein ZapA (FtsZ GTPase activity inhibitor)